MSTDATWTRSRHHMGDALPGFPCLQTYKHLFGYIILGGLHAAVPMIHQCLTKVHRHGPKLLQGQ